MADPRAAYRRLGDSPGPGGALAAVRGPLLVCLVLGIAVSLGATGRVSAEGVLSAALVWSFVPALQVAALAVTVWRVPSTKAPGFSRLADLFFMGHLPWSLWMLAVAGAAAATFPEGAAGWPGPVRQVALLTALVPLALTFRITWAFFREVLALPPRAALRATALYEGLVCGLAILFAFWAAQLWPRIVAP